ENDAFSWSSPFPGEDLERHSRLAAEGRLWTNATTCPHHRPVSVPCDREIRASGRSIGPRRLVRSEARRSWDGRREMTGPARGARPVECSKEGMDCKLCVSGRRVHEG